MSEPFLVIVVEAAPGQRALSSYLFSFFLEEKKTIFFSYFVTVRFMMSGGWNRGDAQQ